jgi:hypothetical protein
MWPIGLFMTNKRHATNRFSITSSAIASSIGGMVRITSSVIPNAEKLIAILVH